MSGANQENKSNDPNRPQKVSGTNQENKSNDPNRPSKMSGANLKNNSICPKGYLYNSMKGQLNMGNFKSMLLKEESRLKQIIQTVKNRLENAPEGSLCLSSNKSGRMYYHKTSKKKYISKNNEDLIRLLAQKSYDKKVLGKAKVRYEQIKEILADFEEDEILQIYLNEHPDRQKFITPVEPTWEQKVEEWKSKPYKGLDFKEETPIILTDKGERVRSKSEKIIADYLYRNGIEYKYECPLYLKGIGWVYPDFTILSKKTGEEIYLEHLGMMDNPSYCKKAINKIMNYEENSIFVGESLILTYETDQMILSTKQLERLVKKYIL